MRSPLLLGSRGSKLALWQANFIKSALERLADREVRLEIIRTVGDKMTEAPLTQPGGAKALFTKEIEDALRDRRIDLAVHSLKDLPVALPAGLTLAAIPAREDARDALISRRGEPFAKLPSGARVGTSSLRRQVQLRRRRQDLRLEPLRGNLDTRLRKLDDGGYDAMVAALAGLKRLGWADRATEIFSVEEMVPAVGQGALAVEARADDAELLPLLARLTDPESESAVGAERAFLARLGGGCQVPLAAHAEVKGERLRLVGVVVSADGAQAVRGVLEGSASDSETLGETLAEKLLAEGAADILAAIAANATGPPGAA